MRALLLVDIQNDFMPSGRLPVAEGDAIIEPVNRIIGGYPLVVASQDWHPAGHESFASSHAGKKPFDTTPIAAVFRKGMDKHTDSYSAFYDNGRRRSTQLAAYVRAHGVTDIDVAGLAADFCVYFSMADALAEGFRVRLLEHATRAIDAAGFAAKKAELLAHPNFSLAD